MGQTLVCSESQRDTYAIAIPASAVAATPTDIFLLQGSATKVVTIKRVFVNANGSAAGIMNILLVKRTAANTGGTSTNLSTSICKYDTNSPAATAVPYRYTANPSALGTGTNAFSDNLVFGNSGQPITAEIELSKPNDMTPRLKDSTEYFAINMNGDSVPSGGLIGWAVVWEEYLLTPTPAQ